MAYAAKHLVSTQLTNLHVSLTPVLELAAAVLIAVALIAAWFPTRRAMRVDPMAALRSE